MVGTIILAGSSGRGEDTPGQGGGEDTMAGCFWQASAVISWIQFAKKDRFSLLKKAN